MLPATIKESAVRNEGILPIEIGNIYTNSFEAATVVTEETTNYIDEAPQNICRICHKKCKDAKQHLKKEHAKNYKCSECHFYHHDKDHVLLHKNMHQGLPATQCPICKKQFAKKYNTLCHMESQSYTQIYNCDKCNQWFAKSTDWKTSRG